MIDAERELALKEASTKELVSELRKRDGVEYYKIERNCMCPLHDFKAGLPSTILRITN